MTTPRVLPINPSQPEPKLIEEAARILCAGGLVAFPTETVYGLAADATNPQAIARLNQVKGRPPEKPYSIHLYETAQIAAFVERIPPLAKRLMERFWPGPLTIVMPAKDKGSVGFRLPSHPVAQAFLRRCQRPVVAPSANRSGSAPPDGRQGGACCAGPPTGVSPRRRPYPAWTRIHGGLGRRRAAFDLAGRRDSDADDSRHCGA